MKWIDGLCFWKHNSKSGEGSSKFQSCECLPLTTISIKINLSGAVDVERGNTIDTERLYGVDIFGSDHPINRFLL